MRRSDIRRLTAAVAALVVPILFVLGPTGAASAAPVRCLDRHVRPTTSCPAVEASLTVAIEKGDLVVTVRNKGAKTWKGGPIAVEVPVEPGPNQLEAQWVERAGVVVARCVFDPVEELEPEAGVFCHLPLTGLADGVHTLWLTGFVSGLPPVSAQLGDRLPAVGVVPVATSRSVRVELRGKTVKLLASPGRSGSVGGRGSGGSAVGTVALGVVALVVLGACIAVVVRRRPRPGAPSGT